MKDARKKLEEEKQEIENKLKRLDEYEALKSAYNITMEKLEEMEKELVTDGIEIDPIFYKAGKKKEEPAEKPKKRKPKKRKEEKKKRTYRKVNFDHVEVIQTAEKLMKEGRAVTVSMIMEEMGFEGHNEARTVIHSTLELREAGYEKRTLWSYAWPSSTFHVYQPKGKRLPFVPLRLPVKEYKKMLRKSKKMKLPKKFDRKEFYKILRDNMEIDHRGSVGAIPSLLEDLVYEGYIKDLGKQTYRLKKKA
ncbi:MAG: hypothetical protein ACE5J7_00835 [Candidatus Aenigmatarchaeota archaeon]